MKVKWTTLDALKIGPGEYNDPVVVWIGVLPKSLCGNDGMAVVSKCMDLLEKHNFTDVEVEIREVMVTKMFYMNPGRDKKRHKLCKHARRAARRAEAEAVVDRSQVM
ncbi:unnamed protein product [Rhizoctonia solani]|nr:unnamed protein product [Rhizoctonia solani]